MRRGAASSNGARLRKHIGPSLLGPVFDRLEKAMSEVHSGQLPATRAQAMASLGRAMVAVLEAGMIDQRLTALEARL